ncbi:MAG: LptF/LptG family permease [Verrucomicrobiales bacterium]
MIGNKIDRYLTRQILGSTLFSVIVLSLVLVLGNVFKEIREMLVEKGAPIEILGEFVLLVLPFSLMYTIPWGFLAAVLLVFGRLSADQEIVSFRGAGYGLCRIALPVVVLGLFFSGICLYLNGSLGPRSKHAQRDLIYRVLKGDPLKLLDPGVVQSRLKDQKIYIERREGSVLRGFHAYQLAGEGHEAKPVGYVYADKVDLVNDVENERLHLRLEKAYGEGYEESGKINQLFTNEAEPWLADYSDTRVRVKKASAMENDEIVAELMSGEPIEEKRRADLSFELANRSAFSLAPLALGFIAIPLGIGARRRETSAGLFLSVLVAFLYFFLLLIADEINDGSWLPMVLLWTPNVLCLVLGIVMLRRSSRHA